MGPYVRNTSTHSCLMDSSVAKPKKSNDAISIKSPNPCIDTTDPLRPSTTKKSVDISFATIAVLLLLLLSSGTNGSGTHSSIKSLISCSDNCDFFADGLLKYTYIINIISNVSNITWIGFVSYCVIHHVVYIFKYSNPKS